jgi:hypothetical protein
MQEERISLRRLDSERYFCDELDASIARVTSGASDSPGWGWSLKAGGAFVYAQRLGECRVFLEAIFNKAQSRRVVARSREQAKLTKVGTRRWRTEDGIEIWSERKELPTGNVQLSRIYVDIAPDDPSVPSVQVGVSIAMARRFISAIPWRGADG